MTIMKNFYKNLIGVMAVATVLLGGATLAHADSVTVIPSLGIDTSTDVQIACTYNDYFKVFNPDDSEFFSNVAFCQGFDIPTDLGTLSQTGTYTIILFSNDIVYESTLPTTISGSIAASYYISSETFNVNVSPTAGTTGLTFFGGTSSGTGGGVMDAPTFLSQTADALGATASGIYPILAIIAGLILTFILITKIAGLYKQTGKSGQGKKNIDGVNSKLTPTFKGKLVRKNMGVWVRE